MEFIQNIDVSKKLKEDVSLGIEFCGVRCENIFFLSSSVVASNYEMVARAFEKGWAGAAFKTIGTFVAGRSFTKICSD